MTSGSFSKESYCPGRIDNPPRRRESFADLPMPSSTAYRTVVDDSSTVLSTHDLELVVERLYVDATGTPSAVIAVRAILTDRDGTVLMTGRYESSTPSASAATDDVIAAWNRSLDAVLEELAADLAGISSG